MKEWFSFFGGDDPNGPFWGQAHQLKDVRAVRAFEEGEFSGIVILFRSDAIEFTETYDIEGWMDLVS